MGETTTLLDAYPIQETLEPNVEYLEQIYALPAYQEAPPMVICVPEMTEEEAVRAQTSEFIGSVLLGQLFEMDGSIEKPINNLYDGIKRAADGDPIALQMVETNAITDVVERTFKNGFVTKPVKLERTSKGGLVQHGQPLEKVQANSLQAMASHPIMGPRTKAETRNYFRTTALDKEGYFDAGYSLVVFSPAEDLPEAGFFTETMSCAVQVTSKSDDGLEIESGFFAGIKAPGEERHDLRAIDDFYKSQNVNLYAGTPAEIIDTPLLIHKSLIPNGVVDVVKILDDFAGGTFFGEDKPRQDYLSFADKCHAKEENFVPIGKKIAAELIAEADIISSETEASKRLNKISGRHAVIEATNDPSIDARVFGPEAAEHVERSRDYEAAGDSVSANYERHQAVMTETSSSCPGTNELSDSEAQDQYGSLSFKCPSCGLANTRTHGNLLTRCQHCSADVTCG